MSTAKGDSYDYAAVLVEPKGTEVPGHLVRGDQRRELQRI
jgi:hypothetical protein